MKKSQILLASILFLSGVSAFAKQLDVCLSKQQAKQFSGEDINIGKLSSSDRETLNTLLTKDKDDKSNEYKI